MLIRKNRHGYLLDLDYPVALYDKHNELPFLPERMMIGKEDKLVPNLKEKRRYVVHIGGPHDAINHGLILTKVHRVIQFKQSLWLKPYIDFNTRLRTAAKNEFEKDFFKLMNCSPR